MTLQSQVDQVVYKFVDAGRTFTAADVTNELRNSRISCRHGEVAPCVRNTMAQVLSEPDTYGYERHVEMDTPFTHDGNGVFVYHEESTDPSTYTFPKLVSPQNSTTLTAKPVKLVDTSKIKAQVMVKFFSGMPFSVLDILDTYIKTTGDKTPDLVEVDRLVRDIIEPRLASPDNFWRLSAEEKAFSRQQIKINIYVPTLDGYAKTVKDYIKALPQIAQTQFTEAEHVAAQATKISYTGSKAVDNTGKVWQKPSDAVNAFIASGKALGKLNPDSDGRVRVPNKIAKGKRYEVVSLTNGDIYLRRA